MPLENNEISMNVESSVKIADQDYTLDAKIISEDNFIRHHFSKSPEHGFEILFRKYYVNLCNNAIRFVHSKELAEDLVAEIFANFWQNKIYLNINFSYSAYLYKAVRFRAYNCLKTELARNIHLEKNDLEPLSGSTPVLKPDEILHFHELSRKIDGVIQKMPNQSKRAFQMHRLEGKKYTEISTELNITVSAVERLISRALAKLRDELNSEWTV